MNNVIDTINSLPEMLSLKPANDIQITDAELQLRVRFSDEYKVYLKEFGAVMADGIELSGIAKSEHRSVVAMTKQERELNPKVPNNMYVIENTHLDGVIIWQDSNGKVYRTQPNKEPVKISDSMVDYIRNRT